MRIYAIGDVHGQLDMLRHAHDRIARDRLACGDLRAPVVHLGDLCDRGPDTAGVLDFLLDGVEVDAPWSVIRGNHDALFAGFLDDPHDHGHSWLGGNLGGSETLRSYGVDLDSDRTLTDIWRDAIAKVPARHRDFMAGFPNFIETEDLILVHAGIRPGVPLHKQDPDDLIWIRGPFLDDTTDHGRLVVHGHTPVEQPMHCGNRIALDTGAGYFRPLTAAVFEGRDCSVLTEAGRVALQPMANVAGAFWR